MIKEPDRSDAADTSKAVVVDIASKPKTIAFEGRVVESDNRLPGEFKPIGVMTEYPY